MTIHPRAARILVATAASTIVLVLSSCASSTTTPDVVVSSSALASAAAAQFAEETADLPRKDRIEVFAAAEADGRVGTARKTRPVDARPAIVGEKVATVIKGDGVETVSDPAEEGDMVVRSRCPETGNEEILVTGARFPTRYGSAQTTPDSNGYSEYQPTGVENKYFVVNNVDGAFVMEAPWGEDMIYKPGDTVIQNPADATDIYRVYSASFSCTYQVVIPAS